MLVLVSVFIALPAFAAPDVVVLHILDDVHPSQMDDYRTDTATHPATTYQFATPSMDQMADSGMRFNRFYAQPVCTPGRSEFWGFGEVGTTDNLMGRVQSGRVPAQHGLDLRVGGPSLIASYHAAGYTVAGFGKLHMGRERWANFPGAESFPEQMGFDHYDAMVQSNDGLFGACDGATYRTNTLGDDCASHNYWCQYSRDAAPVITGDGTSTVGAGNGYVDAVISAKAQAYITDTVLPGGGKHLVVISWHGPHAGWSDGNVLTSGAPLCDYDDDATAETRVDDRPPGSTVEQHEDDGAPPVYGAQLEFVDTQIGIVNGLLHLAAGGLNHLAAVVADNGVANGGTNAECLLSRGRKSTLFECGVNVPLAIYGDDVHSTNANAEVSSLFAGPDLPKTLAQLVGGNLGRPDGYSFADCITNANGKSPANCPGRDVVVHTQWNGSPAGLGGSDGTDGTPAGENPWPPRDGDTAAEWSQYNLGAVTDTNNGFWKLARYYQQDVALGPYCEIFMAITASDPYQATATVPIEETSCSGTFGGALTAAGFTADQLGAYTVMKRELDRRRTRPDQRPTFSGSM